MYSEIWKKDVDEDEFWGSIELARKDENAFRDMLNNCDRRQLIRMMWHFEYLASQLGQETYLTYTDPSFSEDSLDDLWEEVVGRGKLYYLDVLKNPENMPREVDYSDSSHLLKRAISDVFYERFGEEIPPVSYDY